MFLNLITFQKMFLLFRLSKSLIFAPLNNVTNEEY